MSTSTVRPSAVGTVTAFRAGDFVLLPNATSGLRVITKENFNIELASLSRATPANGVATLNSSGKHDIAQVNYTSLDFQGSSTVAALPDPSTLTSGQFYLVTTTGTLWSKTWTQAGEMAISDGTNYFVGPVGIATVAQGGTGANTAAGARTNLEVYSTDEVNDRTNARQSANGVYLDGTAKLVVSDNAAIQFGTNDYALVGSARFDALPAANATLADTRDSGAQGTQVYISTVGKLVARIRDTATLVTVYGATVLTGRDFHWLVAFDRSGNAQIYIDGEADGSAVSIAGVTGSVDAGNDLVLGERQGGERFTGTIRSFAGLNRLPSTTEIAELAKSGNVPSLADQGATNATQTSGTITTGQRYRIDTFVSGDDFTNVGAASNATGIEFVATGTTPTTYSNGSTIRSIGVTVALYSENIDASGSIRDASPNGLHAAGTNTEPFKKLQILEIDAKSPAADAKLLDVKVDGTSKASIDEDGDTVVNTLNISSIPTSAGGLSSGDIWSDSGTLKIVS